MSDDYSRVLAQLEALRRSGDRHSWASLRRLELTANCCKEEPVIEVMNTEPPCVLVSQVDYGHVSADADERKPWSGARRGGQGIVWLAAFERMAEGGSQQFVWCRHRRWTVPASVVVTKIGRHAIEALTGKPGHMA